MWWYNFDANCCVYSNSDLCLLQWCILWCDAAEVVVMQILHQFVITSLVTSVWILRTGVLWLNHTCTLVSRNTNKIWCFDELPPDGTGDTLTLQPLDVTIMNICCNWLDLYHSWLHVSCEPSIYRLEETVQILSNFTVSSFIFVLFLDLQR